MNEQEKIVTSKHLGTIGEKLSAVVTLVGEYEFTSFAFSYYGSTTYIYTMADDEGNVIVWKTTSTMCIPLDKEDRARYYPHKGDRIRISGRIKEHGEYKGTAQTVLTRCKYELIERTPTKEEREEMEARKQRESLADGDMVWRMPYKQYKDHYSDCETIKGSYEFDERKGSFIEVIIRAGRLKNSGVRGEHFSGYQFRTDDEKLVCYRAVSEENARKQMKKDFPQSDESWECVQIFRYATHKTW